MADEKLPTLEDVERDLERITYTLLGAKQAEAVEVQTLRPLVTAIRTLVKEVKALKEAGATK